MVSFYRKNCITFVYRSSLCITEKLSRSAEPVASITCPGRGTGPCYICYPAVISIDKEFLGALALHGTAIIFFEINHKRAP